MFFISEEGVHDNDSFEYHPERSNIVFESMTHIPQNLLLNIVECCRNKMREYCKWCYYRNNEQVKKDVVGTCLAVEAPEVC